MRYRCAEGHEVEIAWQELCKGCNICHTCAMKGHSKRCFTATLTRIDAWLTAHNYLPMDHAEYHGSHLHMPIVCASCGRNRRVTWANLQNDRACCQASTSS